MPATQAFRRFGMGALLALCAVLLFVGGPDEHWTRSMRQGWQFGHVLLFFVLARLALPRLQVRLAAWATVGMVLLGAGLLGLLVEWLQGFVGREVSWTDVRLDVIGAALGLTGQARAGPTVAPGPRRRPTRQVSWLLAATALGTLLWLDILPLGRTLLDEYRAWRDFPVLASWASEGELGRVQVSGTMRIDDAPERPRERALHITLLPADYSGFHLEYFPGDWRGYGQLAIALYLSPGAPASLSCRVHDGAHDNRYADRFNRRFPLTPGWNTLLLPVAEIRQAPKGRDMDMARIRGLGCFFVGLGAPSEIQVGKIALLSSAAP